MGRRQQRGTGQPSTNLFGVAVEVTGLARAANRPETTPVNDIEELIQERINKCGGEENLTSEDKKFIDQLRRHEDEYLRDIGAHEELGGYVRNWGGDDPKT